MKVTFYRILPLMVLFSLFIGVTSPSVWPAKLNWTTNLLEGDRIILHYLTIISEENARALLKDRIRALEFVEDFLQIRFEGTLEVTVNPVLIAGTAHAFPCPPYTIVCGVPLYRLTTFGRVYEHGLEVHEEVHIVAGQQWTTIAAVALKEGLAVAVDFVSCSPNVIDIHLISKGLKQIGKLLPFDELLSINENSIMFALSAINVYYEGASFIHFLISKYEIKPFTQFYRLSWMPISTLKQKIHQIYGKELSTLEEEWHQFLEEYAPGQERRGEYAVEALMSRGPALSQFLKQLESYWEDAPFKLVSPSARVYREYDALLGSLIKLASPRAEEAGPEAARKDYEFYQSALATVKNSLAAWLEAIQTFEAVLNSIPEQSDYGTIIDELEEIQALYREVGDEGMVTRTGEYIAAFQLLQEGENRLMDGNLASAENTLVNALELFSKLDEQQMARQVSRLLELSRHVIM